MLIFMYDSPRSSIHDEIPSEAFKKAMQIDSDGWCGFRTLALQHYGNQYLFPRVKCMMLEYMCQHEEDVIATVCYGSRQEYKTLQDGREYGATKKSSAQTKNFCPKKYWFDAWTDCQLAANTFNRPVVVYSDDPEAFPTKI